MAHLPDPQLVKICIDFSGARLLYTNQNYHSKCASVQLGTILFLHAPFWFVVSMGNMNIALVDSIKAYCIATE